MDELKEIRMMEIEASSDSEYEDVPDGTYIVGIDKMEIKLTKAGDKLMFAVQCTIKDGPQKNRKIFFNRVISGNKNSETWNDGRAIKSVITWLLKLETEVVPEFVNYSDFADCVLDIFQEVQNKVELEVEYAAKKFNPITIRARAVAGYERLIMELLDKASQTQLYCLYRLIRAYIG